MIRAIKLHNTHILFEAFFCLFFGVCFFFFFGGGWSSKWNLYWCCTSSWLPTKLHAKSCRRPSWSLWRHGRGLTGAGNISHRECVGWRSDPWCPLPLWSLHVLQRWSSPLVASICSVQSSAWLCLGDWWGLLFGGSGSAAGCLSWEVWWLRTGSMELAILL